MKTFHDPQHSDQTGAFYSIADVGAWLDQKLGRFCNTDRAFVIGRHRQEPSKHRLSLYTQRNHYVISLQEPLTSDSSGYIGCIVTARQARPGETHTRGRDLHDGPFEKDTLTEILFEIVSYELEDVVSIAEMAAWERGEYGAPMQAIDDSQAAMQRAVPHYPLDPGMPPDPLTTLA